MKKIYFRILTAMLISINVLPQQCLPRLYINT